MGLLSCGKKQAGGDPPDMLPSNPLVIYHFNDVYDIQESDKDVTGGAARFTTLLKNGVKNDNALVLFAGDALGPSMLSTAVKGKQMIECMKLMPIACACYGNHDFDYGVEHLEKMASRTHFPWLLTNVIDKSTGKQLGNGATHLVLEHGGRKIGIVGIVENDWLVTLATVNPDEVEFTDPVESGKHWAKKLKEDEGCDFLIALTHMRQPNDESFAVSCPEYNIVLGGHDHHYEVKAYDDGKRLLCKSGTDFRDLTRVTVNFNANGTVSEMAHEHLQTTKDIEPDQEVAGVVDGYMSDMEAKLAKVIGKITCEMDGLFAHIRTRETNLSNWVADIMRDAMRADVAILNSGTLRADAVLPPGDFQVKHLVNLLPMPDDSVVVGLTGDQLVTALENGVSQYPKMEGRFPAVSGVSFSFDATKPAGSRIDRQSVKVGGEALDDEKEYSVATKAYLAKGKDGYDVFAEGRVVVDESCGSILPTMVRNHCTMMAIANGWKRKDAVQRAVCRLRGQRSSDEITICPKVEGRIVVSDE